MNGIQTLEYDTLGNIIYKSDVGTYRHGEHGAGPHAVTSVAGKQPGVFSYNANGDQIRGTLNGVERQITYTTYSKPWAIKTAKAMVSFFYGADREVFTRIDNTSNKIAITHYLGNYELATINHKDGSIITQEKSYIGPNTLHIKTTDSKDAKNNRTSIYEMLHNNLGSLTDMTDENGNVMQHFAYTPFGEQKQTKGAALSHSLTNRGFTGHQGINEDGINLIHMGGRIYDPVLGRFLSADPFIQDPANSQSLNRYSYCINNPLAYTDPSGFGFWKSVGKFFRSVGHAIWKGVKAVVNSTVGRIVIGVIVGCMLGPVGGALFGWGAAGAGVLGWAAAAAIGAATTVGLGLATGSSITQSLFEGVVTFGIVAGASLAASEMISVKAGAGGIGAGGAAAGIDNSKEKDRVPQGDSYPDQSLYNSSSSTSATANANYYQTTLPKITAGRGIGDSNAVGGTYASKFGGYYYNGARSTAYNGMHYPVDTVTGKGVYKSFHLGTLQIDAYATATIQKGNTNIEEIVTMNSKDPISVVHKEGPVNVAYGVDGSITYGWTHASTGWTADGRRIYDVSIPTGSRSSVGATISFDPWLLPVQVVSVAVISYVPAAVARTAAILTPLVASQS